MNFGNSNNKNHPCRYCTLETGRYIGCHAKCEKYKNIQEKSNTSILNLKLKAENKCGHYMGYIFYPDGRVRGHYVDFLKISYRNNIPYIDLCENGITYKYRLDKAVFRAFHPEFNINKEIEVLHKDGNQRNCKINNLYVDSLKQVDKLVVI